jgi:hypothetical protein
MVYTVTIRTVAYITFKVITFITFTEHLNQGPLRQFFNTPEDGRLSPETCRLTLQK